MDTLPNCDARLSQIHSLILLHAGHCSLLLLLCSPLTLLLRVRVQGTGTGTGTATWRAWLLPQTFGFTKVASTAKERLGQNDMFVPIKRIAFKSCERVFPYKHTTWIIYPIVTL